MPQSTAQPLSPVERIIVLTLAAINFTHIMDAMIMMPLGDIFMNIFAIDPQQFSLLVSAYATGAFISSLLAVFYLDIFDRRRGLIFLYSGFVFGTFLCGLAPSYLSLLLIRFATGLFGGVIGAMALSIVSDVFKFERRGKAMGYLMAGFSAAAALGVPLGLFLADQFNWRMPFFTVAGFGVILLGLIIWKFPSLTGHLESVDKVRSFKNVFGAIFLDRNQVNALILGFVLVMGHFLIIPFIAPYMSRNVGFTQAEITYIYFLGGAATVFSSPMFGKFTDRYGVMPVFITLMVLSFIPVIWITHMPPSPVWVALIATTFFFITGSGRMIPPQTLITAAATPRTRGSFMSIKSALQQLAIALASAISGFIVVFGEDGTLDRYNYVGYLAVIVCIIAMILAPRIKVAQGN